MNIGSATFGFDKDGKIAYLEEIQAIVITEAAKNARNVDEIFTAVDNNWKGAAAEKFKTALQKDANNIATSLATLYEELVNEINNIGNAIADFDNGLMSSIERD